MGRSKELDLGPQAKNWADSDGQVENGKDESTSQIQMGRIWKEYVKTNSGVLLG